jgi:hypothetical protein
MVWIHIFFLLDMMWLDGHVSPISVKKLTEGEWRELFDNSANLKGVIW